MTTRRRAPRSKVRWVRSRDGAPGREEAILGYFRLTVEPASNAMTPRRGGWVQADDREGWIIAVDDGIADPSVPGTFEDAAQAKAEAERIARYTLARRPDRERGTPGYARGALRRGRPARGASRPRPGR